MREWTDVFVPALSERVLLEKRALFFIPAALPRCDAMQISTAYLSALSNTGAIEDPRAGRVAIRKAMQLQPISYERAEGFLNVANHALVERGAPPLTKADIVACVFRLKDPTDILTDLRLTVRDVSEATGLSQSVVSAAVARYRLQYVDADLIWRFLMEARAKVGAVGAKTEAALAGRPQDLIKTDSRQPLAVRPHEDHGYVYTWENLRAAPPSGHYWAIDAEH